MYDRRDRRLRRKIIVAGVVALLAVGLLAGALNAGERDSCWVEYAPGEVRDFATLEDMSRGSGSRVVTYELRHDTINQYYEDQESAREWMGRVVEQLRGCN